MNSKTQGWWEFIETLKEGKYKNQTCVLGYFHWLSSEKQEKTKHRKQADCSSLLRGNLNLKQRGRLGDWGTWADSGDNYEKEYSDIGE